MKTLIIAISTFIITFWAQVSMASPSPTISCSTPNKNKSFIITDDKIVFEKEDVQPLIRSIASINKVKTKKEGSGFTKTLNYEGNKYTIHVNNEEQFDEVEDYLSIRSEKGHEITYPINCKAI